MNKKQRGFDKDGAVLEAVGSIDELVCFLGWAKVKIKNDRKRQNPPSLKAMARRRKIEEIQKDLMGISSELVGCGKWEGKKEVGEMEKEIVKLKKSLPRPKGFVVPGKNELDAVLHICRSVARRVERRVVSLSKEKKVDKDILSYLNRLSSYLFMLGVSLS
ncbi:cob(I)yrinic acid a,c-diamide adenosyltransferase [Patescibacteria group bacterium]|nr:cob(I)yrinic acid a,c-diamide adenosyltransferase [Patescibacteria group bacterium]MCG2701664.1 cob(I)yrinic acid a,c-diamide adenosyltransferase [Candidatus Parcubacteria bacterium]MBU4265012.1 cob(I)yrinic acid a,c-diamide adenosyltransferase [Patescibacteria group bacterium]MBU4390165.1 cob(I)yrinic acid a,c-diamide adenosyltransferase [Patescibacteria group bacterium]MBU4397098.1 cob(I)yrinic acid a,c-diamide adenosyltransferase [Patescibacteria group bacterium]